MEFSPTPLTDLPLSTDSDQLDEVISALSASARLLVLSHLRPDGDALGSVTGLARSLRKAGKMVDIGFADPPPERFAFLLEGEPVQKPDRLEDAYDAIVILDSGDLSRTGFEGVLGDTRSLILNIDHHSSNTSFGEVNYLDFEAGSTSELIVNILRKARLPLDAEVAEGLYLGLLTDTRFFQNENLRPSTHLCASILLATGLDTRPILNRLNRSRSLPELKLLGIALSRLETRLEGRMTCLKLTRADLVACNARLEHVWSCGLFGQMVALDGSIVGVAAVEDPEGKCFAEFRSSGGFNVKDIAVEMGGGGHLAASGCNRVDAIESFAKDAFDRVEKHLTQYLKGS